jgi:hypothetical protein
LFSQLLGASVFSKIDFLSRYHTHTVQKGNVPKSAIHIWYDHYEFLVMPFGLTSTLLVFMDLMNQAFHGYLECTVDSFVYSTSRVKHGRHLVSVLEVLSKRDSLPSSCEVSFG